MIHSANCWGANLKLNKFEFDCLYRINTLPQGVRDWYEVLKKDSAEAKKTCPACLALEKKNKS